MCRRLMRVDPKISESSTSYGYTKYKSTIFKFKYLDVIIMNFLELLDNLVGRDHILSFLQVNDLLRLRRVCKNVKSEAEDFLRTKRIRTGEELVINFADDNPFQNKCVPIWTKMHFCMISFNAKILWGLGVPLANFLQANGPNITHLTLGYLPVPFFSTEVLQFLESFPNLAHLTFEEFQSSDHEPTPNFVGPRGIQVPSTFKKLKTLSIGPLGPMFNPESSIIGESILPFFVKLVETSITNLEKLMFLPFQQLLCNQKWGDEAIRLACKCIFGAPNLKFAELSWKFIRILVNDVERTPEMGSIEDMQALLLAKVISINDPDKNAYVDEYPNLEVMEYPIFSSQFIRGEWQKLKEIKVNFGALVNAERKIRQAWNILFGDGIVRENVVQLNISFWDVSKENPRVPRAMDIATSCPNLKILRIDALFSHHSLPELWRGLANLEQLHFGNIRPLGLGDADLIGEDPSNPAFLCLKNLKVLTLTDSEITDNFFTQVLRHMPLKKLEVRFDDINPWPCRDVHLTIEGIRSLLTGKFAGTIERLSVRLEHLSTKELLHVMSEFKRSKFEFFGTIIGYHNRKRGEEFRRYLPSHWRHRAGL